MVIKLSGRINCAVPVVAFYDVYRTWTDSTGEHKQLAVSFEAHEQIEAEEYAESKNQASTYVSYHVEGVAE